MLRRTGWKMAALLWMVAGEASGDARGAELVRALHTLDPGLQVCGAGGPRLQSLACEPFDPWIDRAAVLGLWDVLRQYGYFRKKFHAMLASIARVRPGAVILVDYPGFNLRLAAALRKRNFPGKIICYISPQVWAWNRGRIPKIARLLDLMICVFPFEKPMWEAVGLRTVFAGHPLLEALMPEKVSVVPRERNLLGLFPGSRRKEVQRNFPVMVEAARRVARLREATVFEVAAANAEHAAYCRRLVGDLPMEIAHGRAHELMRRARAGIVCSGTATLEAAFFELPYALIYKAAWLTFEVGKRLVDVNCLGIVNILNNYRMNPPPDPRLPAAPAPHVIPEFIQHMATPDALAQEAIRLLNDEAARRRQLESCRDILAGLEAQGASERAARAILEELRR